MDYINWFQEKGALKRGHFARQSGKHTDYYVQPARLFEDPQAVVTLAQAMAEPFRGAGVTVVLSAAIGGMVIGFQVAAELGCRFVYVERRDGALQLRRGFDLSDKDRVLIVEDEVMTGASVEEMRQIASALGAPVVGMTAVVDKSGGRLRSEVPFHSLVSLAVSAYPARDCPLCQDGLPLEDSP